MLTLGHNLFLYTEVFGLPPPSGYVFGIHTVGVEGDTVTACDQWMGPSRRPAGPPQPSQEAAATAPAGMVPEFTSTAGAKPDGRHLAPSATSTGSHAA